MQTTAASAVERSGQMAVSGMLMSASRVVPMESA